MERLVRTWVLVAALGFVWIPQAARAMPPETLASVVSVLPDWPGQPPPGTRGAPEGTGIAVAPRLVATAWHVIAQADGVELRLSDGRILPAQVVAHDARTDIALVSVETDLRPFDLAPPASAVAVGLADPVCAIGNGFGLGLSVSCGVVSALGVTDAGFNGIEDFVQTDAAINPGFSGGALVDRRGRLVGMVSAIFASDADTNIGINFAVSAELLARVVGGLAQGELVFADPGWRLAEPDRATLRRVAAPVVHAVAPRGAAAAAGVQAGDLVLEVNGRRVRSPRDAVAALALVAQDAEGYSIRFERAGDVRVVDVAFAPAAAPGADPGAHAAGTAPPPPLADCPHPDEVCRMRQAVFPVSGFDPLGSATRIGPDLLVTNRHVVGDAREVTVFTPTGPRMAQVLASDYGGDLALLKVSGLPEEGVVPTLAASGAPLAQSDYYVIGADIARELVRVFMPGALIATPSPGAALGRVHVTARMQPGVSGGALVDATGALVGIAVGGGEGRFEAIPVAQVRRLLEGQGADNAEVVTHALGTAYAACAGAMELGVPDATAAAELAEVCRAADNHGQLLEAGRLLAQGRALAEAAELHG
ncbi:MAG: trypsin-like peptidase domain-containing protein, partial [Pseudomonadota bacterium]